MKILGLQHAEVEHPGYFRHLLKEDGHEYYAVNLDQGEEIPSLHNYDALWVLGGPMDVWQVDQFPWLTLEKKFIRDAVFNKGIPYFGLCLGHQLLAETLGGKVGPSACPEIGVKEVSLTEIGIDGVFFDGVDETLKCLQWHSAEVTKIPVGAEVLATSDNCAVQALKWSTRAYSVQFHLEVEADTVSNWSQIPEYDLALIQEKGSGGSDILRKECESEMASFNKNAERIYLNWMQTSAHI